MQAPIFRGYITKKNVKSYDFTFNIWCTSRTHIRTFLRFHGFPESDRLCTFLIVKGNKYLIIVEIDGIDEGIHQCLPLLRLGHIQLAEAKQPKPDELLFHLWLSQPFLCNAGLQFPPLLFQIFQPLFPHGLFIAGLFLLGGGTLVIGIHFPGVADTAFSEHQCTALAAVQLGGEQIAFLCLMTGRGLFIFRQLFLHLVEQVRVCAAERSGAMKVPVGLLSDRTVLRSKMEGSCPDKFA